jgi:signal transduction histidine kinase/CheY-like chemotaxis protein
MSSADPFEFRASLRPHAAITWLAPLSALATSGVLCIASGTLSWPTLAAGASVAAVAGAAGAWWLHGARRAAAQAEQRVARVAEESSQVRRDAQVKTELITALTHEVRTPLNGVLGMAQFLLDTQLEDEQRQSVHAAKTCGETLLALVNDVLDYGKLESGLLPIQHVPLELRDLVEDVLEMLGESAAHKGLVLVGDIDDGVPERIVGDPLRLRQVLINLSTNAIQATTSGEVALRVALEGAWNGQPALLFEVVDTGPGLDAADLEQLFTPAVAERGTALSLRGAGGIGLSIAKSLIERMGGKLGASCRLGVGCAFRVELPLQRADTVAESTLARESLSGVSVLVVEAHPKIRTALERLLLRAGAAPSVCADVEQAARLLTQRNRPFAAALIDRGSGDSDGLAFGRSLARRGAETRPRLVLLSNTRDVGLAERAREHGFNACLAKPVRGELLLDCLSGLLCGANELAASSAIPRDGARCVLGSRGRPPFVLVAEDNPVNQRVVQRMLERSGCRVLIAENGWRALERLGTDSFDLVLMDCQMPEMDGYTATAEWRAREPRGQRLPIVALTANAIQGDRERCLAVGMDDYLSKPVQEAALLALLARWRAPATTQAA